MTHWLCCYRQKLVSRVCKDAPLKAVLLKKVVNFSRSVRIDQPSFRETLNAVKAVEHLRRGLMNAKKDSQTSFCLCSERVDNFLGSVRV